MLIDEKHTKIANLYMDYPVKIDEYRKIGLVNARWLAVMGLQETAYLLVGITIRDMIIHPKNHS